MLRRYQLRRRIQIAIRRRHHDAKGCATRAGRVGAQHDVKAVGAVSAGDLRLLSRQQAVRRHRRSAGVGERGRGPRDRIARVGVINHTTGVNRQILIDDRRARGQRHVVDGAKDRVVDRVQQLQAVVTRRQIGHRVAAIRRHIRRTDDRAVLQHLNDPALKRRLAGIEVVIDVGIKPGVALERGQGTRERHRRRIIVVGRIAIAIRIGLCAVLRHVGCRRAARRCAADRR